MAISTDRTITPKAKTESDTSPVGPVESLDRILDNTKLDNSMRLPRLPGARLPGGQGPAQNVEEVKRMFNQMLDELFEKLGISSPAGEANKAIREFNQSSPEHPRNR